MDPISVMLLAALAGGAGGEMGRQAWAGLTALVRRPFRRSQDIAVSSGEVELARLERAPADPVRGQTLSTALAERAAVDAEFRSGLEQWHEQARLVRTGDGDAHNQISGGTFNALVQQGRDFSGTSSTTNLQPSAPLPTAPDPGLSPTQD
jgi:hypothetical protein